MLTDRDENSLLGLFAFIDRLARPQKPNALLQALEEMKADKTAIEKVRKAMALKTSHAPLGERNEGKKTLDGPPRSSLAAASAARHCPFAAGQRLAASRPT